MKIKQLIDKLENLDQEKEISVEGYITIFVNDNDDHSRKFYISNFDFSVENDEISNRIELSEMNTSVMEVEN